MTEKKSLYDYKLGELCEEDLMEGVMEKPNKLVMIAYTYQSVNGVQMTVAMKHEDYLEDEDDD